jgi:hypothetical protein
MTREEIENMPAGQEMDALITKLLYPDAITLIVYAGYSGNLLDAWEIVESVPSEVYLEKSQGRFFCMIGDNFDNSAEAETCSLAICRAFLLYSEYKQSEKT